MVVRALVDGGAVVVRALVDGGVVVVCALVDGRPVVVVDDGAVVYSPCTDYHSPTSGSLCTCRWWGCGSLCTSRLQTCGW